MFETENWMKVLDQRRVAAEGWRGRRRPGSALGATLLGLPGQCWEFHTCFLLLFCTCVQLDTTKPHGIILAPRLILQLMHGVWRKKPCMVTVCLIIARFHVVSLRIARQMERRLPFCVCSNAPGLCFMLICIQVLYVGRAEVQKCLHKQRCSLPGAVGWAWPHAGNLWKERVCQIAALAYSSVATQVVVLVPKW